MELKNNEKEIIFKDKYSMSLEENIFIFDLLNGNLKNIEIKK